MITRIIMNIMGCSMAGRPDLKGEAALNTLDRINRSNRRGVCVSLVNGVGGNVGN